MNHMHRPGYYKALDSLKYALVDGKAQLVRKGLQFSGRVHYVPSYYTQNLCFMY